MVGIVGAQLHLAWLDPLTAILVGFLICRTAWGIFWDATHDLTDGFDENLMESFKKTVLSVYGVKGVKDIRARNYSTRAVVDIILLVRSDLDIRVTHDISTKVEKELMKMYDISAVHVHVEPN